MLKDLVGEERSNIDPQVPLLVYMDAGRCLLVLRSLYLDP